MRIVALVLTAAMALAIGPTVSADVKKPAEEAPPQSKLMKEKLRQAQLLLDGLATNDFVKIEKSAKELMIISKTAEFTAIKTREYELHTNEFRRALETITKRAQAKNLDGATLGYVDMTMSCVHCHEHTREIRNASVTNSTVP